VLRAHVDVPQACTPGDNLIDGALETTDPNTLDNPSWTETSTQFGSPLCSLAVCGSGGGTAGPHGGTFWSWFGGTSGVNAETASLAQTVTFPTGATSVTLNFYLWIGAVTTPFTDTLVVQVDGVTQTTFTEPSVAELGYTLRSVDLTAFADGAAHEVKFLYNQPAGGGTGNFSVDDISLDVVCGGAVLVSPYSLTVDPLVALGNLNGVLEMNEGDVEIAPGWQNDSAIALDLTGTASNLSFGTIVDATASYGTIQPGGHADCLSGGLDDCYFINLTGVRTDHPVHFDVTMDETIVALPPVGPQGPPPPPTTTWTLHVGQSFSDVDSNVGTDPYYPFIETIFHNGVTVGCGAGDTYCPLQNNLRKEMAVFLLKGFLGAGYTPPDCAGIFDDVPCPPTPEFPYSNFIEDLNTRGITAGCQVGPPALFCPEDTVTRAQMAPFLLKTLLGGAYTPPACTGIFDDVPCPPTPEFPFSNFIEDLFTRGITTGCQVGPPALYCPDNPVTRQEMAVFLTKTFSLVLYGPPVL
jgi:hypothetical protein